MEDHSHLGILLFAFFLGLGPPVGAGLLAGLVFDLGVGWSLAVPGIVALLTAGALVFASRHVWGANYRAGERLLARIKGQLNRAPFPVVNAEHLLGESQGSYTFRVRFKRPPAVAIDKLQAVLTAVDPEVTVQVKGVDGAMEVELEKRRETGGRSYFPVHPWLLAAVDDVLPTLHDAEPVAELKFRHSRHGWGEHDDDG